MLDIAYLVCAVTFAVTEVRQKDRPALADLDTNREILVASRLEQKTDGKKKDVGIAVTGLSTSQIVSILYVPTEVKHNLFYNS